MACDLADLMAVVRGGPKMKDPQVTMGFNTILWSFMTWMISGYLGYHLILRETS